MTLKNTFLIFVLLSVWTRPCLANDAHQDDRRDDRRVWDGTPINVDLQVNQERRIQFPVDVDVEIIGPIVPLLRTQIIGNTIYWNPYQAFDSTRVIVTALNGSEIYLLNVTAKDSPVPNHPITVFSPSSQSQHSNTYNSATNSDAPAQDTRPLPGYVTLVRWMARELYAPNRLRLPPPFGVSREPVDPEPVDLVRGHQVDATPVIAWRGNGIHMTAVKLVNRLAEAVVLDPRQIRGQWLNRTLQHARLGPAGSDTDTTVVYLMSRSAFGETVR